MDRFTRQSKKQLNDETIFEKQTLQHSFIGNQFCSLLCLENCIFIDVSISSRLLLSLLLFDFFFADKKKGRKQSEEKLKINEENCYSIDDD